MIYVSRSRKPYIETGGTDVAVGNGTGVAVGSGLGVAVGNGIGVGVGSPSVLIFMRIILAVLSSFVAVTLIC